MVRISISAGIACLLLGSSAIASEYRLKLIQNSKQQLSNLSWDKGRETQEPTIEQTSHSNPPSFFVTLKGIYTGKASLLSNDKIVSTDKNGVFTLSLPIEAREEQTFTILEVDPTGAVKKQETTLQFSEWKSFLDSLRTPSPKNYSLSLGLGFSGITYEQSGWPLLVEIALTPRLGGSYLFGKHWEIAANLYATALALHSNPSATTIQFVGGNLRGGYKFFLSSSESWVFKILAGYYYATTISSALGIGYQNVQGPELFPVLAHLFPSKRSFWIYFKLSPVMNRASLLSLTNYEAAAGGGFLFLPTKSGGGLGANIDISSLRLNYSDKSVLFNSYTLGLSYSL